MSHNTYQEKWTECMQELMEQVQIEYLPAEAAENGQSFDLGFQHYALLYIKYLQIYRKLEDCHNQMVHPQKRRDIWRVLRSTIYRILELKQQIIHYNPRSGSRFVALDEVLTDLKLNPDTVEWKVPRYFLDDKEAQEEIDDKLVKIDHWLGVFSMSPDPHPLLDEKDPFDVNLTVDQAVAIIQKNERGRMGINRADMVCSFRKDTVRKEERSKRAAEKADGADDLLESQVLAATRIAAHWKRKVDRRRFLRMREEEFEFLGMAPPRNNDKADIIEKMRKHRENRKKMQEDADTVYQQALKEQLEWLQKRKGQDIKADLLEERRQWILECYQRFEKNCQFPNDFDEFYKQYDKDEEDDADKGKDGKGKGKEAKAKDDKGKKGKGGKKDAAAEEEDHHDVGPSAVVQQFAEHINQYMEKWENRDESNNFDQKFDVELARKNVYPIVEAELRALVDDQMREELANLKLLFEGAKKKKGGKAKKPKKPKKPKPPKKWCAAVGSITNREDCVPDLVEQCILKKVAPVHLEDFWGEYHFLGAMLRSHHKFWGEHHFPPPSAQMIRSLLIEHCVLPLAQTDIRQKAPETLTARSLLLYGPKGSGKSMLARAIATETGATFFDLSPSVIEGKSTQGKTGSAMLVYKTFICAQDMAPSVIYIDQVDLVYQAVKKGKKGGDANAPSRIQKDLSAAIKQVKRGPEATEQDRILFIGCTSRPFDETVNTKELVAAFDEKVWVSFPEYGSRVVLWQKFMQKHGVSVDPAKLNVSTLARISDGYSAGSIKQTVDRVLTARRVQQLKVRPLKVQEFIGPLSRTAFCWKNEYELFSDFDFEATGEKALHERRAAEEEKAEQEAASKGKGKR